MWPPEIPEGPAVPDWYWAEDHICAVVGEQVPECTSCKD